MNVSCPICDKTVSWNAQSPFRPFCSKQCQLIDLGEWASEERAIAQKEPQQAVPDEEEIEAMLAQQEGNFFKQ